MQLKVSNLLSKAQLVIVITVFIVLVLIGYITFFTPNHFDKPAPFTFEIKDGESLFKCN